MELAAGRGDAGLDRRGSAHQTSSTAAAAAATVGGPVRLDWQVSFEASPHLWKTVCGQGLRNFSNSRLIWGSPRSGMRVWILNRWCGGDPRAPIFIHTFSPKMWREFGKNQAVSHEWGGRWHLLCPKVGKWRKFFPTQKIHAVLKNRRGIEKILETRAVWSNDFYSACGNCCSLKDTYWMSRDTWRGEKK